jgi:hypothetical protein
LNSAGVFRKFHYRRSSQPSEIHTTDPTEEADFDNATLSPTQKWTIRLSLAA